MSHCCIPSQSRHSSFSQTQSNPSKKILRLNNILILIPCLISMMYIFFLYKEQLWTNGLIIIGVFSVCIILILFYGYFLKGQYIKKRISGDTLILVYPIGINLIILITVITVFLARYMHPLMTKKNDQLWSIFSLSIIIHMFTMICWIYGMSHSYDLEYKFITIMNIIVVNLCILAGLEGWLFWSFLSNKNEEVNETQHKSLSHILMIIMAVYVIVILFIRVLMMGKLHSLNIFPRIYISNFILQIIASILLLVGVILCRNHPHSLDINSKFMMIALTLIMLQYMTFLFVHNYLTTKQEKDD
jgi:uncharacterized membrane protein